MAIDSATIGANFSQYSGDPNLGGGSLGVAKIDTRPLEDLAKYTMLYNKAEYDQRQKDAEKAAAEIADYMSLDYTTSVPEDFKYLQGKFDEYKKFLLDNIDISTYKDKKAWGEWQSKRGDLLTDIKYGKMNNLANLARQKEIAEETTEEGKKILKEKLQQEITGRKDGIRTLINMEQKRDLSFPTAGENTGVVVDVTQQGSNEIFQRDLNIFNVQQAKRAGAALETGLAGIDQTTTTGQLQQARQKDNGWVKAAALLNQAIQSPEAKNTDGAIDESKLSSLTILDNIKQYNEYLQRTQAEIASGVYLDKLGNKITFGVGPFRKEDYTPLNWKDGLSAGELAEVMQFSKWAGDKYDTKVIQTNTQTEKDKLAVQWFNAKTGRIQEDRLAKVAGVSDDMALSAKKYAEALVDKLNGLKSADGIIPINQLSKLTADELKYLGVATTNENKFSLTPLTLKDVSSLLIENDGTIKVFSGGTGKSFGTQRGSSINVATIATNKLGDEMVTTTGKEGFNFNSLIPLYQSANTQQPSATTQKQSTIPEGTIDEFKKAGWSDAQIKEAVKKGLIKVQ